MFAGLDGKGCTAGGEHAQEKLGPLGVHRSYLRLLSCNTPVSRTHLGPSLVAPWTHPRSITHSLLDSHELLTGYDPPRGNDLSGGKEPEHTKFCLFTFLKATFLIQIWFVTQDGSLVEYATCTEYKLESIVPWLYIVHPTRWKDANGDCSTIWRMRV